MDNKCTHCNTTLDENGEDFVYLNFGGLLKNEHGASLSDTIDHFCYIGTHSHKSENSASIDLTENMQYNGNGQAESYFCNKQCLNDWFINEIKDIG